MDSMHLSMSIFNTPALTAWASFQCLGWQIQNGVSGECVSVMKMSAAWFIPWMGKYFSYRGKINKKNEIKLHVSWWQWQLKDVEESHLTEQLTEREWRSPLTWLDRFRDAVLLPASWGDENIQPHVGNRRWNVLTSIDYRSFNERSPVKA